MRRSSGTLWCSTCSSRLLRGLARCFKVAVSEHYCCCLSLACLHTCLLTCLALSPPPSLYSKGGINAVMFAARHHDVPKIINLSGRFRTRCVRTAQPAVAGELVALRCSYLV